VPVVAQSDRSKRTLRGAFQIAVVVALLSLILPGRGITLFVVAFVVGFLFGLVAELVFERRRR
jgi:hypothetical protein